MTSFLKNAIVKKCPTSIFAYPICIVRQSLRLYVFTVWLPYDWISSVLPSCVYGKGNERNLKCKPNDSGSRSRSNILGMLP